MNWPVQLKKAVPVTPQLLSRIFKLVDLDDIQQVVSFVGLVVGFLLFLRKSNLVPDTIATFNPAHQLVWGDLWWYGRILMVDIKWSKTLQYRQKELELPLVPGEKEQLCAVHWLTLLKKRLQPKPTHPVLGYPHQGDMVPLTYGKLAQQYQSWISQLGLDVSKGYTLHGLRRGGTNHALTVGICGEDVQLMGDWKTQAYMAYVDLTMERRIVNMVHFVKEVDDRVDCDDWEGDAKRDRDFWVTD